jgi:hypothetical protein
VFARSEPPAASLLQLALGTRPAGPGLPCWCAGNIPLVLSLARSVHRAPLWDAVARRIKSTDHARIDTVFMIHPAWTPAALSRVERSPEGTDGTLSGLSPPRRDL